MFGEIDPKVPNLLTGRERILDAALLRANLGLGTLSSQNSNAVSISGGSISNTTINNPTISSGSMSNITSYNGNFYSPYLSTPYISNASYLNVQGDAYLYGKLFLYSPSVYTTNATLGSETVSYVKGTGATICVGTPTYPCNYYSFGACPTELNCTAQEVYCPNYNGDQGTCESYGCSYEQSTFDCAANYFDEYSCNSNYQCSGWQAPTGDCSSIGDESTCNSAGGGMYCSWSSGSEGSPCSGIGDESTCNSNMECGGWQPASTSPCSSLTDEWSCNAQMECGGWQDDGMGGFYCAGGDYTTGSAYCAGGYYGGSAAYCSGSTYPDGSPYCAGSYNYYTGNCIGTGGYCAGTASCTPLSSGACTGYAGCSTQTGIAITVPTGQDGQYRMIMNIDPNNSDVILSYNSTTKTLSNFEDYVILHYKRIPQDCTGLDESTCNSKSGCGWYYDEANATWYCSGTWYDEKWYNFS